MSKTSLFGSFEHRMMGFLVVQLELLRLIRTEACSVILRRSSRCDEDLQSRYDVECLFIFIISSTRPLVHAPHQM
jgi:hypothetical protein